MRKEGFAMMQTFDVQRVLDKIVDFQANRVSPQILRRTIEYAKVTSSSPTININDGTGGKSELMQRAQGFINGYASVVDDAINTIAMTPYVNRYTKEAIEELSEKEMQENQPASDIVGAANYAMVVILARPDEMIDVDMIKRSAWNAARGFLDGAQEARINIEAGKWIRSMNSNLSAFDIEQAFEMVSESVIENDDFKELLFCSIIDDAKEALDKKLDPKSGYAIAPSAPVEDTLTMYMLGYIRGAAAGISDVRDDMIAQGLIDDSNDDKENEYAVVEIDVASENNEKRSEEETKSSEDETLSFHKKAPHVKSIDDLNNLPFGLRNSLSHIAFWGEYRGFSEELSVKAINATCAMWAEATVDLADIDDEELVALIAQAGLQDVLNNSISLIEACYGIGWQDGYALGAVEKAFKSEVTEMAFLEEEIMESLSNIDIRDLFDE